jgi:hypothetical protein
MDPQPQVPLICVAIKEKRRISFSYHGRLRVAEPQCYGISTRDKESLRVFLIQGISEQREPLFTVTEMLGLSLLEQTFTRPGPNYKKNDSAMRVIYCQL